MRKQDPTPKLHFNLLGPPEIYLDGVLCHDPVGMKDRALLFYLATTGVSHSRQTLAALLWGDNTEASARASLRKALQRLRERFDDFLVVDTGPPYHVGLRPAGQWWVDTAALVSGMESDARDTGALTRILALYRADFLAAFYVRGAAEFEAWMLAERARLRELFLQRLRMFISSSEAQGDLATAILLCRRILELEPWREEVHCLLMRLLHRNGERSAALAQYKICVAALAHELGVPPDKSTEALYEQILHSVKEQSGPEGNPTSFQEQQRRQLPIPPTSFVGREQELREIANRLQESYCRLLTITGPGGAGKTRLALAAAEQNAHRYRDGAWFIPLEAIERHDYIPSAVATALGIVLEGSNSVLDQVLAYLQDREMLLILDNFEHLLPGASYLTAILDAAPHVTLLVTSRERTRLYGEHCHEISGLLTSDTGADEHPPDAVKLFIQRAEQQRADFRATGEDVAQIAQICALVDGLPLGIELAASWTDVLSCPQILHELHNNLNEFPANISDIAARHRSLNAVIQHSWKLLSNSERRVMRGLAVFRGGFEPDAAKAVVDASILQLSALLRKSLLQLHDRERYQIHEFIRQYAEAQLRLHGEESEIRDRHLRYFVKLAQIGDAALLTGEQIPWLLRLEKEYDNLRAALSWSDKSVHMRDAGIRLFGKLGWYWYFSGQWREGFAWAGTLLSEEKRFAATEGYVQALYAAGGLATALDQYDVAARALNRSIEVSRQINDRKGLAFAQSIAGFMYLYTGQYRAGKSAALESVKIFLELDHQPGYRWALGALGEVNLYGGDLEEARRVFEECVRQHEQIGITSLLPYALVHLGKVECYLGDYDLAREHLREGLTIARELGAMRFTAQALHGLCMIGLHDNDVVQAAQHIREAILLLHKLGDGMGLADCLDTSASVFRSAEQFEIAAQILGASDAFREEINVPVPAGSQSVYTTEITYLQQQLGQAPFRAHWSEWRSVPTPHLVTLCTNHLYKLS